MAQSNPTSEDATPTEATAEQEADDDFAWLDPPEDPLDVPGWDQYWLQQLNHGIGPAFSDMFCDDLELIEIMNRRGFQTVLCAGNGISQEASALAAAGFQVTALDLSPFASHVAQSLELTADDFQRLCGATVRRKGGSVAFVTGNILDSTVCPGPYDVIIERRTAQLFANRDIAGFMNALCERLHPEGILLSHSHDGGWRPEREPVHWVEPWLRENGWNIWKQAAGPEEPGRVAWLVVSTG